MSQNNYESVLFGAGCFWGVEETFAKTPGVVSAESGYAGGHKKNPTYREVCSGNTGHSEVVKVDYDPSQIAFEDLLNIFWKIHDPTSLNKQGPDTGSQYRSAIYYTTKKQAEVIQNAIEQLNASGQYNKPIVTEVKKAEDFWRAEEYHQKYYQKNNLQGCSVNPNK